MTTRLCMCQSFELVTECSICHGTGVVDNVCMQPGCTKEPLGDGPLCAKHGCRNCGDVIMADVEDWKRPLCFDCWHAIGQPKREPGSA